jgi:hypothetical protein
LEREKNEPGTYSHYAENGKNDQSSLSAGNSRKKLKK